MANARKNNVVVIQDTDAIMPARPPAPIPQARTLSTSSSLFDFNAASPFGAPAPTVVMHPAYPPPSPASTPPPIPTSLPPLPKPIISLPVASYQSLPHSYFDPFAQPQTPTPVNIPPSQPQLPILTPNPVSISSSDTKVMISMNLIKIANSAPSPDVIIAIRTFVSLYGSNSIFFLCNTKDMFETLEIQSWLLHHKFYEQTGMNSTVDWERYATSVAATIELCNTIGIKLFIGDDLELMEKLSMSSSSIKKFIYVGKAPVQPLFFAYQHANLLKDVPQLYNK